MTDRERLQAAIDEALALLGERDTGDSASLAARITDRGERELRKQLGDTIYDLARRCATSDPEVAAFTTTWPREPADETLLRSAGRGLEARLKHQATGISAVSPDADPLTQLDQAIEVLETLEGRSDSSRYLRCLRAAAEGDWKAVVVCARTLAEAASSPRWRRFGGLELIFGLLRCGDFEAARREIDAFLEKHDASQMVWFHQAVASACMADHEAFRAATERFRDCRAFDGEPRYWRHLVDKYMDQYTRNLGLAVDEVRAAFGVA